MRSTHDACQLPDASTSPKVAGSSLQAQPTRSPPGHTSLKKRRLSYDESANGSAPTSLEDLDIIRRSLARLEDRLQGQQDQEISSWTHPTSSLAQINASLPDRLDNLDELLTILPCQSDCETLFEYILQEVCMVALNARSLTHHFFL